MLSTLLSATVDLDLEDNCVQQAPWDCLTLSPLAPTVIHVTVILYHDSSCYQSLRAHPGRGFGGDIRVLLYFHSPW
jgi:hypothetical protein